MTDHDLSDAIRAVFERRASAAAPGDLVGVVLARSAITPQPPPRLAVSGWLRPVRLFVAAALVAGLGAALVSTGGAPRVEETASPAPSLVPIGGHPLRAERFVAPFGLTIPDDTGARLISVESDRVIIGVASDGGPAPELLPLGQGDVWPGLDRGIVIGHTAEAWGHAEGRFWLRTDIDGFLDDFRHLVAVPMSEPTATSLGDRPAVAVDVPSGPLGDIHLKGPLTGLASGRAEVPFGLPARMILADIDGRTIFAQVWSRSADDLSGWLPEAERMLATIRFDPLPGGGIPPRDPTARLPSPVVATGLRPFRIDLPASVELGMVRHETLVTALRDPTAHHGLTVIAAAGPAVATLVGTGSPSDAAAYAHPCPAVRGQPSRAPLHVPPDELLADLAIVAGAGLGEIRATTIDGRPAWAADLDASAARCPWPDLHVAQGAAVPLNVWGRIYAVDVDGATTLILAWATPSASTGAWLPVAETIVGSLRFLPVPET